MLRIALPLDTTWLGFFAAFLLLTILATIYLHAQRVISSSQAWFTTFSLLTGSAIAYLALYSMGFSPSDTGLLFFVNYAKSADWFSLAIILANCLIGSWVMYARSVQRIDGKRAFVYISFALIISCYLVLFWYRLGSPLAIALPAWIRLPVRPDGFNFLVEFLCGLGLFKAAVDRLKERTTNKQVLARVSAILTVTMLLVVGWYSLASALVRPIVPDWLVLLVSALATPPVITDMFMPHKRHRWRLSAFAVLIGASFVLITASLVVSDLPSVLDWALTSYDSSHPQCDLTEALYKFSAQWLPQWSQSQRRLVMCSAGLSSTSDGKRRKIAFLSTRDGHSRVYVMNVDGSDQQTLTGEAIGEAIYPPTWSPDGQQLAFTTQHAGVWKMYTMNADGSHLQLLSSSNELVGGLAWLPDGKQLGFSSLRSGHYQTYVMDTDGANVHQIYPMETGHDVTWSPNGKYAVLIFTDGILDKRWQLFIINSDRSIDYPLLNDGLGAYQPSWSPDARQIAFTQVYNGRNIMLINTDGTELHALTSGAAISGGASWSPDGQQITFESNRSGHWAVYVVNVDGKNLHTLTRTIFDSGSPAWQP